VDEKQRQAQLVQERKSEAILTLRNQIHNRIHILQRTVFSSISKQHKSRSYCGPVFHGLNIQLIRAESLIEEIRELLKEVHNLDGISS